MKINALMLMGIIIGYIFIVLAALTMLGVLLIFLLSKINFVIG